jgi:hypothetical protein
MKYLEFTPESPASRDTLVQLLTHNVCTVKFTKVNGEMREMPCTLSAEHLPPRDLKESPERKEPHTSLSVWCMDKSAWRSFRIDNVISVSVQ